MPLKHQLPAEVHICCQCTRCTCLHAKEQDSRLLYAFLISFSSASSATSSLGCQTTAVQGSQKQKHSTYSCTAYRISYQECLRVTEGLNGLICLPHDCIKKALRSDPRCQARFSFLSLSPSPAPGMQIEATHWWQIVARPLLEVVADHACRNKFHDLQSIRNLIRPPCTSNLSLVESQL